MSNYSLIIDDRKVFFMLKTVLTTIIKKCFCAVRSLANVMTYFADIDIDFFLRFLRV